MSLENIVIRLHIEDVVEFRMISRVDKYGIWLSSGPGRLPSGPYGRDGCSSPWVEFADYNAIIAQWMGIVPSPIDILCPQCKEGIVNLGVDWLDEEVGEVLHSPPNYMADLNEMLRAEQHAKVHCLDYEYAQNLADIIDTEMREWPEIAFDVLTASASQRASALVYTLFKAGKLNG